MKTAKTKTAKTKKSASKDAVIKPTQEWFSRVNNAVTMPVSEFISSHTKITPTQLTILSVFVGVFSGLFLAMAGYVSEIKNFIPGLFINAYWMRVIGGVLAYIFAVLDGVDGKVARLTGMATYKGKWWDMVAGHTSISLMFLGLAIGLRSYFALALGFIACVSYLIAYLQIAVYKVELGSVMEKHNVELIKKRKSWSYIYGMSLLFIFLPLSAIFNYPMFPLYFYAILGPLFYLAVLYFQHGAVCKIRDEK